MKKAKELSAQIKAAITRHDVAREQSSKLHIEQRTHVAGEQSNKMDHEPFMQKMAGINRQISKCESDREQAAQELKALLPEAQAAVRDFMAANPDKNDPELVLLLGDNTESALVRCERAAEFLVDSTPK